MKAIFFATIFVALIAFALAACDATAGQTCGSDYATCSSGVTDLDTICACYGTLGSCLNAAGCLVDANLQTFQTACNAAGCPSADCDVGGSASTIAASLALAFAVFAL